MARSKQKEKENKGPPSIENKKARFNYEILETLEAGIVLLGTEVKSLRTGKGDVSDAFVTIHEDELRVTNMRIEPYKNGGAFNHEETRSRQLLLKKKEITRLKQKLKEKGLALVVLKSYFNERGLVKLLLGLGKGKKVADKRETEKKREADKEIARAMKEANR